MRRLAKIFVLRYKKGIVKYFCKHVRFGTVTQEDESKWKFLSVYHFQSLQYFPVFNDSDVDQTHGSTFPPSKTHVKM